MAILLENATVVTLSSSKPILEAQHILIDGETIDQMGRKIHTRGIPIAKRIDCSHMIVMPGLVNAHCHLTEILQKSFRDNARMEIWRGYRTTTEDLAKLTEDEIGTAAELACSEMLKNGVNATFVFTAFVNWTANGRSVLPMVPAIAILIARNLKAHPRLTGRWAACMLIPAAALSVMVMWSDYSLANSARTAAREIHGIYGHSPVWFEGHWGFQYYMQALGGKPVEKVKTRKLEARIVVIPVSNTNVTILPSQFMPFDIVKVNASGLPNIMNKPAGAGFYASLWGSLPYSFNGNAEQLYPIYLFQ